MFTKGKMNIISAGTRAENLGHKWLVIHPIPDNECCIELVGEIFMRTPIEIASAEHLIKCWNCHADLLEACKMALEHIEDTDVCSQRTQRNTTTRKQLRQAIAKTE